MVVLWNNIYECVESMNMKEMVRLRKRRVPIQPPPSPPPSTGGELGHISLIEMRDMMRSFQRMTEALLDRTRGNASMASTSTQGEGHDHIYKDDLNR